MRILHLASKDLRQILRDWKAAFFLLIMPIAFTLLFGFAFGGFEAGDGPEDPRLPVGFFNQDQGAVGGDLEALLANSGVIRLVAGAGSPDQLGRQVGDGELAGAVIVPAGYSQAWQRGEAPPLELVLDPASEAGFTVQGEIQAAAMRLAGAARAADLTARLIRTHQAEGSEELSGEIWPQALARGVAAWETPPIEVIATQASSLAAERTSAANAFAHSSPGMMAQFAIAGLMGAAEVLVAERKTRSLQRLLTTQISRFEILFGHYLAMFVMILAQLVILTGFGQLFLRLGYARFPMATGLMVLTTALFCASLGLLIGALAQSEEQVIVFSLIPMFLLAGLGGAWVPLEFTPESFQRIAYFTPVAWVMDGFKDILLRGQGLAAVGTAGLVLFGFAAGLFILAAWRFQFE